MYRCGYIYLGIFPVHFRVSPDHAIRCSSRQVQCKFEVLGCPWRGPFHEQEAHENDCAHPRKSGFEVVEALKVKEEKRKADFTLFKDIFGLLSYEKITFSGECVYAF